MRLPRFRDVVIGLLLGLFLGLIYCQVRVHAELREAEAELDSLRSLADSAFARGDSMASLAAERGRLADSLLAVAHQGRPEVDRAAAAAWRARFRARVVDSVRVAIRNEAGGVEVVYQVPPEVVTRLQTDSVSLAACQTQAGKDQAALEACTRARHASDSALAEMTGAFGLQRQATDQALRALALERSKQGINLGLFRLHLIPKVSLGFGGVYNINCPDESYRVSEAVAQTEDVRQIPITYPPGLWDYVDGRWPGALPAVTTDRTVTVTQTHTIDRSSGCQRWVYGPSLTANLLQLKF